ncbi:MAG TPA: 50S ribosomal protein L25 [Vicinamibacterales bacterium]|nr:50S ribosomal protein L25 [Vicinamibacterales bacterium]
MDTTLVAERRTSDGGNVAGRLRRSGRIPAVVYGGGGAAESVSVDPKELSRLLHSQSGVNTLIALKLDDGEATRVLVREYQLHPVTHRLLHADFYRVAMDRVLRVTVPVHLTGEAKGIKAQGGVLDFVHRELTIECLPGDIPEHITVDVTDLMIGEGVRVRDLAVDARWMAVSEPEMLLVHVVAPRAEPEPEVAEVAPAATAEPEVIKKGKPDEADGKE